MMAKILKLFKTIRLNQIIFRGGKLLITNVLICELFIDVFSVCRCAVKIKVERP